MSNFETQARRLRYQALGSACKDLKLRILLTGHHRDDQAETLLMRLIAGHTGPSLKGIKPSGRTPECWGLHGMHESGSYEFAKNILQYLRSSGRHQSTSRSSIIEDLQRVLLHKPIFESGGLEVLRPLLEYSKAQLVRTCEAGGILWEDDKTNTEVWHTPRNAVRSLLNSGRLPQALNGASLVALDQKCRQTQELLAGAFHEVERECEVIRFDVRSGVLIIRLVRFVQSMPDVHTGVSKGRIAARVLAYIMSSVTPLESIDLEGLETAAKTIFADFKSLPSADPKQPVTFTAGAVKFQRIYSPVADAKITQLSGPRHESDDTPLDPNFIWSLSRQPFANQSATPEIPAILRDAHSGSLSEPNWTSWQLWDGRYWIRIRNFSMYPVLVRSFLPTDLQAIKATIPNDAWRKVHEILAEAAPGKIRWTLPALVQKDENEGTPDKLLSLPSLGETGRFDIFGQEQGKVVDWEIRYKQVFLRAPSLKSYSRATDRFTNIRHHPEVIRSWETSAAIFRKVPS